MLKISTANDNDNNQTNYHNLKLAADKLNSKNSSIKVSLENSSIYLMMSK
ncbi:hypothetical protein [Borreliella lusitaniae]|nr:hypothetical protein [Borreliella lusitaniae]WNY67271.1 hypothetical protein QIA40_04635 [Borreliella lusitaniae]